MTEQIEDAGRLRRWRILVAGSVLFLVVVAILNAVLDERANDEAAALRADVEATVAGLGDAAPTFFWMIDGGSSPVTSGDGRSLLTTADGFEPSSMAFAEGRTFVLYRIEVWGKERCVRVVFSTSGTEISEQCVLL